jgi:hypothetical protein
MFSDAAADLLIKCSQSSDFREAALSESDGTDSADEARRAKWRRLFSILATVAAGGGIAYGLSKFPGSSLESKAKEMVNWAKDKVVPAEGGSNAAVGAQLGGTIGAAAGAMAPHIRKAPEGAAPRAEPKNSASPEGVKNWLRKQFLPDVRGNDVATDSLDRFRRAAEANALKSDKGGKGGDGWLKNIFTALSSSHARPDATITGPAASLDHKALGEVIQKMRTNPAYAGISTDDLLRKIKTDSGTHPLGRELDRAFVPSGKEKGVPSSGARKEVERLLTDFTGTQHGMGRRSFLPAAKRMAVGGGLGALALGTLGSMVNAPATTKIPGELK